MTAGRARVVWRIRDRATFEALRRAGRRGRRGAVTVTFVARPGDAAPSVAYAVGRRVGGAVVRNRLRRRLRAVVREMSGAMPPGAYLVAAGREAAELPFEDLRADVRTATTAACGERCP